MNEKKEMRIKLLKFYFKVVAILTIFPTVAFALVENYFSTMLSVFQIGDFNFRIALVVGVLCVMYKHSKEKC